MCNETAVSLCELSGGHLNLDPWGNISSKLDKELSLLHFHAYISCAQPFFQRLKRFFRKGRMVRFADHGFFDAEIACQHCYKIGDSVCICTVFLLCE